MKRSTRALSLVETKVQKSYKLLLKKGASEACLLLKSQHDQPTFCSCHSAVLRSPRAG